MVFLADPQDLSSLADVLPKCIQHIPNTLWVPPRGPQQGILLSVGFIWEANQPNYKHQVLCRAPSNWAGRPAPSLGIVKSVNKVIFINVHNRKYLFQILTSLIKLYAILLIFPVMVSMLDLLSNYVACIPVQKLTSNFQKIYQTHMKKNVKIFNYIQDIPNIYKV